MDIDMWLRYHHFVVERHRIWERRQAGEPGPWTSNPVLRGRKFTNVFRILDPGSQFVLTDLFADVGCLDALARIVLYRHTNHPDVWRELKDYWGGYPTRSAVTDPNLRAELSMLLNGLKDNGKPVFNPAYLIYPGHVKGANKVDSILERVAGFVSERGEEFIQANQLEHQVRLLQTFPGIGDFIGMQVATDWNYGPWGQDAENSYILAGPGARRGAQLVFPNQSPEDAIREAWDIWQDSPEAPDLQGRLPSLMDVQNTMCEFSKYARYLGQAPGRAYEPAHPGPQEPPVLPQHWTTKGTSK